MCLRLIGLTLLDLALTEAFRRQLDGLAKNLDHLITIINVCHTEHELLAQEFQRAVSILGRRQTLLVGRIAFFELRAAAASHPLNLRSVD